MARASRWRFVRRSGRDMRAASGIIGAAACLAALALLLALEGQAWLSGRLAQLEQHGLVLLPAQTSAQSLAKIAKQIDSVPLLTAEILSDRDRAAQISFWLGPETELEGLPVPQAIRLNFTEPLSSGVLEKFKAKIKRLAPESEVVMHDNWGAPLRQLIRAGQTVALLAAAGLLVVLAACTSLACRARLAAHQPALALLPLLGAGPAYLTRHFAWQFFRTGLIASIIGCVVAFLLLLAGRATLFFFLELTPAGIWPAAPIQEFLLIACIPPICALSALWTARRQVFLWLNEMDLA